MYTTQTTLVCTIAHNRCETAFIKDLFDAGMNVARLNTTLKSEDAAESEKLRSVLTVSVF